MTGLAAPSTWLAAWLGRRGVFYGWVIAGIVFCALFMTAAVRALPAVLLKPLEAEFQWERASIALGFAISLLLFGMVGPLVGRLMDTAGPRVVLLGALVLMIVGSTGIAFMQHVWQFDLLYGVIVGLGSGGAGMVLVASVVSRWFVARRGLVTGVLSSATSAGQVVFVPLLMWLTLDSGWRTGLWLIVGLLGLLVLPLVMGFFCNTPDQVGQQVFGAGTAAAKAAAAEDDRSATVKQAMRSPDFWWIAAGYFICGYTTNGLIGTHFVPHATEHGIGDITAASILGVIGGTSILGTIATGMLLDRVQNRRYVLAGLYLFRGLSLLILPAISGHPALLAIFGVLYGLNWFGTAPATQVLLMDLFGKRYVGQLAGWAFFSHQAGSALAAFLGGWMYDRLGGYEMAFISAGFAGIVAAALSMQLREGRRRPAPQPVPA